MPRQFPSRLLLTRTSFRAAIRFAVSFADTFPSSPSFPVKRQHLSAPKIRVRRPSINRARNRHTGSKNSQHVSFSATSSPGPSHPPVSLFFIGRRTSFPKDCVLSDKLLSGHSCFHSSRLFVNPVTFFRLTFPSRRGLR